MTTRATGLDWADEIDEEEAEERIGALSLQSSNSYNSSPIVHSEHRSDPKDVPQQAPASAGLTERWRPHTSPAGSLHVAPPPPPPPRLPGSAPPATVSTPYGSVGHLTSPQSLLDAAHAQVSHAQLNHNGHGSLSGSFDSNSGRTGSLTHHLSGSTAGSVTDVHAPAAGAAAAHQPPAQLLTRDKSIPTHAWQPTRSAQSSGTPLAGPPRGMTAQHGMVGENAISIAASPPWANMLSPIPSHTPAFSWAKMVSTPDGSHAAISPELAEAIIKGEVTFDRDGCIHAVAVAGKEDKQASTGVAADSSKQVESDMLLHLEAMLDAKLKAMETRITQSFGVLMQQHQAEQIQTLGTWLSAHGSHVIKSVQEVLAQQLSSQVQAFGGVTAGQLQPIHIQVGAILKQALQSPIPTPGPPIGAEIQLALHPLFSQLSLIHKEVTQQLTSMQQLLPSSQQAQQVQQQLLRQQQQQQQQSAINLPQQQQQQHTITAITMQQQQQYSIPVIALQQQQQQQHHAASAGISFNPSALAGVVQSGAYHQEGVLHQAGRAQVSQAQGINVPSGLPFAVMPLPGLQPIPRGTATQGHDQVDSSRGATPPVPPGLAPFPGQAPFPGLAPLPQFGLAAPGANQVMESSPEAQPRRQPKVQQQLPHQRPIPQQQQQQQQQQQDHLPASSELTPNRGAIPRQGPTTSSSYSPAAAAAAALAAATAAQAVTPDSARRSVFLRLGVQPTENEAGYVTFKNTRATGGSAVGATHNNVNETRNQTPRSSVPYNTSSTNNTQQGPSTPQDKDDSQFRWGDEGGESPALSGPASVGEGGGPRRRSQQSEESSQRPSNQQGYQGQQVGGRGDSRLLSSASRREQNTGGRGRSNNMQ